MRSDSQGLFWQDSEKVKATRTIAGSKSQSADAPRMLPPIPVTGWTCPFEFPRLDSAKEICIDVETYDHQLLELGPGVRRDGYIVGLAVGTEDDRWYFPMRHTLGGNMDPEMVMRWAREELTRKEQPKYGANLLYDLDFLAQENVIVQGDFYDVQLAEPLLDENAFSYSLSSLASKHLGEGKVDEALYEWSLRAYGGKAGRAQAANIYRCPTSLVGPYAESDVDLPLRVFKKQKALLEAQGLWQVFRMECDLIPMMLAMRRRGVRIDLSRAQAADDMLTQRIDTAQKHLGNINVNAADDIARLCKKHGIEYPTTDKGNPSFKGAWLEKHSHPALNEIKEIRRLTKARDTFIRSYIFGNHINGRIHCQFHQLRSDEFGTVSGRFSSSNPNLQNIPSRDEEIGPMCRSMFMPDVGQFWQRFDWSQIEYRLLVHYAIGEGADIARSMYNDDPNTDFHIFTSQLTGLERKPAKNINFGLVYGMGEPSMARNLGRPLHEVKPMFDTYHAKLPFVRETFNLASQRAANVGYVRTMLGRRRRFDLWEPQAYSDSKPALPREKAIEEYGGRVRRASTHKALNAVLQGTAADIMKRAMLDIWKSGACDVIGAPLSTVHDEVGLSVPFTVEGEQAVKEVQRIMETCVKLKVPMLASGESGPSWGEVS